MTAAQSLALARSLELPTRAAVLHREPAVHQFWNKNRQLLADAWREWEMKEEAKLSVLASSLFDPKLRAAVERAWENPQTESEVRDLWEEVTPGVFLAQFFDPDALRALREYLDEAWRAEIPTRPPYGIVLNRYGAMLDPRSEGFLAAPSFQSFYRELMDRYMRPVARLLFPTIVGYDAQTFGFSIRYQAGVDTSLRLHTDASSATLNINMNLPGEAFSGSEVDFYDPQTGTGRRLSFEPGVAMLHRGNVPHAAQPITAGERNNIVLWLYGERGAIPNHQSPAPKLDARLRWSLPEVMPDGFSPF